MANRIDVVLDDTALKDLQLALADSPRQFYATANNIILPQAQTQVEALLNKSPGPVTDDFEFATPKSQRYYFATHKQPYKRTNEVLKWKLILKAFTGQTVEILLENPTSYAKWVFGDFKGEHQVPGHKNTGYVNVAREVPAITMGVLSDLSEAWLESLDTPNSTRRTA